MASPTSTALLPQVDWVPPEAFGFPARLGLTCVPGGWREGSRPDRNHQLRDDLHAFATVHAAHVLVTLLEPHEIAQRLGPGFASRVRGAGLVPVGFPIADCWVPSSMDATLALVAGLVAHLRAGRTLIVHCLAGLGRTGTIAACCLVACGRPPGRAIEVVRGARPGAIQTEAQAQFVAQFAEAWWRPQASAR